MELSYFQLLSKDPVYIPDVGGIVSPTLKDISAIGDNMYQYYLNILLMDLKTFFAMINRPDDYENLSDDEKFGISVYDVLTQNIQMTLMLQGLFNFFIREDVRYSPKSKIFEVREKVVTEGQDDTTEDYKIIGTISRENYQDVVNVICQRVNIKAKDVDDPSKAKSKKALAIMKKLKKGREGMEKTTKADKNMGLGNVISAVANRSQSLNIINIWDLTVYQLWDCFARLVNNNIYDINAASVSAWGDKEKKFDFNGWYKKLND